MGNVYKSKSPEGKGKLRRHGSRLQHNIKMDVSKVGYEEVEWIKVTQNSVR